MAGGAAGGRRHGNKCYNKVKRPLGLRWDSVTKASKVFHLINGVLNSKCESTRPGPAPGTAGRAARRHQRRTRTYAEPRSRYEQSVNRKKELNRPTGYFCALIFIYRRTVG